MSDEIRPDQGRAIVRLTLLPEVLPVPPDITGRAAAGVTPGVSVRRRTIGHLRRVMAAAAATAAVGTACVKRPELPPVGLPQTGTPADPGQDGREDGHGTTVENSGFGYMVVDMLPPPALCSGVAAAAQVSAAWLREGDDWIVRLVVQSGAVGQLELDARPVSLNGQVLSVEPVGRAQVVIRWKPDSDGQAGATLRVPASANGQPQSLGIEVALSPEDRVEGAPLHVSVWDTCR